MGRNDDDEDESFGGLYEGGHWVWDESSGSLVFVRLVQSISSCSSREPSWSNSLHTGLKSRGRTKAGYTKKTIFSILFWAECLYRSRYF